MGSSRIKEYVEVDALEVPRKISEVISRGYNHLITITGIDEGEKIGLVYHLSKPFGETIHVKTSVRKHGSLPSIAGLLPGAYIYEMEVHDMFGVFFDGNQWMKYKLLLPDCYPLDEPPPLWKDADPGKIREKLYEATSAACTLTEPISGTSMFSPESVVVPFGPYHPALKEPEHFRLVVEGEKIVQAIPRIGFVHRGIEKAAERRSFLRDIFLLERICGICSMHHSWTFVEAVEKLLGLEVDKRAIYIRTLVAELERIHSHSLWLGLVGYWMGFETMFMWVWGLREDIMDLIELIAGNRVHKSIVTIGGVRRDVSDEKLKRVKEKVASFEKRFSKTMDDILSLDEFIARTSGIGKYSLNVARKLCVVGPPRRAVGDGYDIRRIEPYGAYEDVDFSVITDVGGDVYSLIKVRMFEILESSRIIQQIVEKMPSGNPVPKREFMGTVPKGEAYARTEAPRGELFYYVATDNKHSPSRVKVRTPTLANISLAAEALRGQTLSDVPLVITMIDPCFSCMDRVLVVDRSDKSSRILDEGYFRRIRRGRKT